MLAAEEQDEKCRASCYLGYDTSNFFSVKEVLLWGGLRLWLPLKGKKKTTKTNPICKSEDSQLQGYSKETVLGLQRAAGREGLPEAGEQHGGIHQDPGALHTKRASALGHTTGTRDLVPSPALGATARKVS